MKIPKKSKLVPKSFFIKEEHSEKIESIATKNECSQNEVLRTILNKHFEEEVA